jgi:hypothetical protein
MTNKLFSFLVSLIQQVKSTEAKIALAKYCGTLASKNYCGTFRDRNIDAFFKSYARKNNKEFPSLKALDTNQIVHVFTTTYITGGHTRFLENLVQLDDCYVHHLLITDQGGIPARQSLFDIIQSKGGEVHLLPKNTLNEQISAFQAFISEKASKIMLHIHPHDILPSIALHNKPDEIEVLFFNHADHLFSYGCDVSTAIINIREEAQRISVHERYMQHSCILPLPIIKKEASTFNLSNIREKYGVKENDIIGLSIGNTAKFYKNKQHHFFKTIYTALEQNPRLKIFVVGVSQADFCPELDVREHQRLEFLGAQKDPSELQRIADIAIDPMPFGSYTALLETCYYGAYPLVCYNTIPLFNLYTDEAFNGKISLDLTEESYLQHLHQFCEGKLEFSKIDIADAVKETHAGSMWVKQLHHILKEKATGTTNNTPLPSDLSRFYELNQPAKNIQYSALVFFYEHIHLFTRKEVMKIILHLTMNRYSRRETLGILKKSIQSK